MSKMADQSPKEKSSSFTSQKTGSCLDTTSLVASLFNKHVNYFRVHVLYILVIGFLGSVVIFGIELNGPSPVAYIDALFTAFSAVCVTGLSTLDTSLLRSGSAVTIWFLCSLKCCLMSLARC